MDLLKVSGGTPLKGNVKISGAKNAALPILFAAILSKQKSVVRNVPLLADINTTQKVLDALGLKTLFTLEDHQVEIDGSMLTSMEAPYELVRTMRASVLVLGPLLARTGEAKVSLPGGCAIGARPIDFHLAAFEKMGAEFKIENGYVFGKAKNGLQGAVISFPFPSVGATENVLMGACLAKGSTEIQNAACEPEITDLAKALKSMGARITGEGTPIIKVVGVPELSAMNHAIAPDRVEAITFLCAALLTKGKVTVEGIDESFMKSALDLLERMGAKIIRHPHAITAEYVKELNSVHFTTEPFPGFPTDMQAQFMTLLTSAKGTSTITETIFENRFMHVPELNRLGAKITLKGNQAFVEGPSELSGATVMATDLRASASLVIAGLAAKGTTLIRRIYHLDRGYEQLEQKFASLGGNISREFEK